MSDAPSTKSLWDRMTGDMLGLGPLMRMMSDPGFQASCMQMMGSLGDSGRRAARIEAKLDYLMRLQGHGAMVDHINETVNAALGGGQVVTIAASATAAVSDDRASAGAGGDPDASVAPDDGATEPPRATRNGRDHAADTLTIEG